MAEANPIRSFGGIHPTAGNLGEKDSPGRSLAREINRTEGPTNRARAVGGSTSGWSEIAKSMANFKRTSGLGVVRLGRGRLNIGAFIDTMYRWEGLDWG